MNTIDIRDQGIVATLFSPDKKVDLSVVVLGGSKGGIPKQHARAFAAQGFNAFALAYFKEEGLPDYLRRIPLEYFENAFEYFQLEYGLSHEFPIVGTSRGGELALLIASELENINKVVAYVPSGILCRSYGGLIRTSAWTKKGIGLPYANPWKIAYNKDGTQCELLTFKERYNRLKNEFGKATIPIEKINGSIMLISGQDDNVWPSAMFCDLIEERAKISGFPHECIHLSYDNAGHHISAPRENYSSQLRQKIGGTTEGDKFASENSWEKVVRFLKE